MTHITYITHSLIFKHIKKASQNFLFLYIKITNNYYQKDKERLKKEAREIYQHLFEEEKDKRR